MKKIILLITLLMLPLSVLSVVHTSAAATDAFGNVCEGLTDEQKNDSTLCSEKGNTENPLTGTDGLLLRTARLLSIIIGIMSVIMIIYGAVKYMTSGGVAASVENAKHTVMYAIVGLVVSLMAQGIILFLINNIN